MTTRWFSVILMTGTVTAASVQSVPELRLTRELRIDAAEHDLSPITFLAVAPNGTMVVSQPQDGFLRFFDARGTFLGTFGRKGRGPGEFADLSNNRTGVRPLHGHPRYEALLRKVKLAK